MKSLLPLLGALTLPLAAHAEIRTFVIDAEQSRVETWVPHWQARGPSSGSFTSDEEGNLVYVPDPTAWELVWQLEAFSLSGAFQGENVLSPYNDYSAHLTITDPAAVTDAPDYVDFRLPATLTYFPGSGEIDDTAGGCSTDVFYQNGTTTSGYCQTNGYPATMTGYYDGTTLTLHYDSGGYTPMGGDWTYSETEPELPTLSYGQRYRYKLVAAPVPEAQTYATMAAALPLVMGAAALRRRRRA